MELLPMLFMVLFCALAVTANEEPDNRLEQNSWVRIKRDWDNYGYGRGNGGWGRYEGYRRPKPYGRQRYGRQPYGRQPYGRQPYGRPPYGRQPYGRQPYGRQPYGRQPYGRPPYDRQPYGRPPYDRQPYGRPPYDRPPYGRPPYDRQPRPPPYRPYGGMAHGSTDVNSMDIYSLNLFGNKAKQDDAAKQAQATANQFSQTAQNYPSILGGGGIGNMKVLDLNLR